MDEELRNLQRLAYQNQDDGARVWKYLRQLERLAGFSEPEPETQPVIKPGRYQVSFNITFPGAVTVRAESADEAMDIVDNFFEHQLDLDWISSLNSAVVVSDWADFEGPAEEDTEDENEDENDADDN